MSVQHWAAMEADSATPIPPVGSQEWVAMAAGPARAALRAGTLDMRGLLVIFHTILACRQAAVAAAQAEGCGCFTR